MSMGTAATRFARIAVAFDDSAGARAALARAVALARVLPDARLTVIAIDELPEQVNAFAPAATGGPRRIDLAGQTGEDDASGSAAGTTSTSTRSRTVQRAEDWMRTAVDYAQRHGVQLDTELRIGHPAGQILIAARAARADLIVIGHSRHPELHNRVLGSTAEHVARHAYCSVLIAH
ncbi:universal stress protein [Actinocrinis sp.]|jgi:nucleotide-binding universal stress UspA family protein|uniref:universal stress protein n=1 Tax=Actinocrinis sp. TaxID=1920516 RepID=UPI002CBABCE8|nr:universal stress protein [Actinocrinis sp.]HXR71303.1 universal stress protein [Actinocrinis sp.]